MTVRVVFLSVRIPDRLLLRITDRENYVIDHRDSSSSVLRIVDRYNGDITGIAHLLLKNVDHD